MEALVESADRRRMVLGLLQIVWCGFDELMRLATSGGIAAATAAASTPNTSTTTTLTATQRGNLRLTRPDTAGSSPTAKNPAAAINTNAEDAEPSSRTTPYITATPAEASIPR
jgi:hypothetical protein